MQIKDPLQCVWENPAYPQYCHEGNLQLSNDSKSQPSFSKGGYGYPTDNTLFNG